MFGRTDNPPPLTPPGAPPLLQTLQSPRVFYPTRFFLFFFFCSQAAVAHAEKRLFFSNQICIRRHFYLGGSWGWYSPAHLQTPAVTHTSLFFCVWSLPHFPHRLAFAHYRNLQHLKDTGGCINSWCHPWSVSLLHTEHWSHERLLVGISCLIHALQSPAHSLLWSYNGT